MSGFSLTQAIRRALAIRPDAVAVIDGDMRFTRRQFAGRVARLAAAFIDLGVRPGDRIVLLALNSHRTLECFYAAMWAGGVIVPLNHRLGLGEIVAQTDDCSPKVVVLGPDFASLADALASGADGQVRSFVHSSEGPAPDGFEAYEDLLAGHDGAVDAGNCGSAPICRATRILQNHLRETLGAPARGRWGRIRHAPG